VGAGYPTSRQATSRQQSMLRQPSAREASRPPAARRGTGTTRAITEQRARNPRTRPPRPTPPRPRDGVAWPTVARRLRISAAVASAVILLMSGGAWALYRNVTAGITTTNVIAGGSNDGEQNILLVGVDSREDAQGNPLPQSVLNELHGGPDTGVLNSDTIIVLHVPADGGAAVAFSVPRDSYVDIPGYRTDKINAAYPATKALAEQELVAGGARDRKEIEAEASAKGRTALIGAVEDLTGLTIDHYAEINLVGFATLTKAIGGVEVCLKAPANDVLSGAHLPAGLQTLSGADALAFVRQRHGLPQGDLSRIRRQQVFLAATADKILSAGTLTSPTALASLIAVAQQSVVIDSGWDLLAFAREAADIAKGNLSFVTIPTSGNETNSRGDVVLVDPSTVHDFVDRQIQAQEDAARTVVRTARPTPPPFDIIPSRYVVDLRNGSGADGLAGDLMTQLRGQGFLRGTLDNTITTAESVVRYTGSDGTAADELAAHLGGIATASVDDGVTPGHLMVVLGQDFDRSLVPVTATARTTPPPAPSLDAPITADGVRCVD
jgi:LCP family protein required for cell wall assembly